MIFILYLITAFGAIEVQEYDNCHEAAVELVLKTNQMAACYLDKTLERT